jgi:hypothetical protein
MAKVTDTVLQQRDVEVMMGSRLNGQRERSAIGP